MRTPSLTADRTELRERSPLARIAFVIYAVLVVYASLYPMTGWRDHGLSPLAYLASPWPRYVTSFDLAANVLGYVPYGFLCVLALQPRFALLVAFAIALASAAGLSLGLEAVQSYLPSRVATNLDVLCNLAGAACGAALAVIAAPALLGGPLKRARTVAMTSTAPVVLRLFGAGDLRDLLSPGVGRARAPEFFVTLEAFIGAANLVSVALLVSLLSRPAQPVRGMFAALVLAALAVKVAAFAVIMHAENVLVWLTPGAQFGLLSGLVVALGAVALPRVLRLAAAAVLLMVATVLVNLAPPNPYLAATLKLWQQGPFLNFNGLTRVVSSLWAYVALGYLMFLAARRREPVG